MTCHSCFCHVSTLLKSRVISTRVTCCPYSSHVRERSGSTYVLTITVIYHVTRLGGGRVVVGGVWVWGGVGVGCGVGWGVGWVWGGGGRVVGGGVGLGGGVGDIFPRKATNFLSDLFRFHLESPD